MALSWFVTDAMSRMAVRAGGLDPEVGERAFCLVRAHDSKNRVNRFTEAVRAI